MRCKCLPGRDLDLKVKRALTRRDGFRRAFGLERSRDAGGIGYAEIVRDVERTLFRGVLHLAAAHFLGIPQSARRLVR